MDLDVLNALVRDLLISEGKYNQHKNKVFKSKKDYKRKKKHKKKNPDD
jgi:hypothetical protein